MGIVLSGGGVRGIAHIGILQALNENGIEIEAIAGSSAGALVGALYASGYTAKEMLGFFKEMPLIKLRFYTYKKPGLMDSERYIVLFSNYFPDDSYAALKKRLFVSATDLISGEEKIFSKGELIKTLLASAAIPAIFSPIVINDRLYADGGITNNFPVEPLLKTNCDFIIGSHTNPLKPTNVKDLKSTSKLISRATELRFYADTKLRFRDCDFILEPPGLHDVRLLETNRIDDVYQVAYEYALTQIDLLKAQIASTKTGQNSDVTGRMREGNNHSSL